MLVVDAVHAETPRNWVVVQKNILGSGEDLYIDINFRQKIGNNAYMISTLTDTRGVQHAVEIFGNDGTGGTESVFLKDKKYRSIVSLEVFSCKEKKRGSYLTLYRSDAMGKGRIIYREENAEDRGERGDFIPLMPLMYLPGEASLMKFACTGRL
jgi:hypothetical protein